MEIRILVGQMDGDIAPEARIIVQLGRIVLMDRTFDTWGDLQKILALFKGSI